MAAVMRLRTATPTAKERPSASGIAALDTAKLRGGYYTSLRVAGWLCDWAVRNASDVVLEPSCGDGVFLEAAVGRLLALGARPAEVARQLCAVEIISAEARSASARLKPALGSGARKIVRNADFFEWWQEPGRPDFDVVIGNPPFIRFQSFPEPHRARAMAIMGGAGLSPNRLTNIWAPFVVAAVASLKANGRLALVLPAEILQVAYAAQLRSFLTDRFARIDVIACNELFFEYAEQEVVLLLADRARAGSGKDCRVALTEARTVSGIVGSSPALLLKRARPKTIRHESEKWLKYFLSDRQISFLRAIREAGVTAPMSAHADIRVGVVTGKNEFFVLSAGQVKALGLERCVTPLVSRAAHLAGSRISAADLRVLAKAGERVHLLDIGPGKISAKLWRYIKDGEQRGFHKGYKCSIRHPWYHVPSVWAPDGFVFRQIYEFPRMVLNASKASSTDAIHRLRSRGAAPELIIANAYTWLTAASAEIEGRSYGGGVLELEPTEAGRLLMPARLGLGLPLKQVDALVRAGRLDDALKENARLILGDHMGLSASEQRLLKGVWTKMRERRNSRRRNAGNAARENEP